MTTEIRVPELGESIVDARVARWLKREGERVAAGDPVVELETDKIDVEVGAPRAGILARIDRREGEDVKIGEVLGVVEAVGEAAARAPEGPGAADRAAGAGAVAVAAVAPPPAEPRAPSTVEVAATPSARRLAREQGVDLAALAAAGQPRVRREDVARAVSGPGEHAAARGAAPREAAAAAAASERRPPVGAGESSAARAPLGAPVAPAGARREERVRLSRRRLTIARRLVEAQRTAAMLTTFNEVDMSAVMALRARRKQAFQERYGASLGIVSFFVKAAVTALREFPQLNAEIQQDEVVLKYYYDIGIAVGAEGGLVVPVLRDADRLSFPEIELAIRDFARRAAEGTLTLEDLRGGTFTITNGGVFGSLLSTPILNPPQVAILGLHKIQDRPVVVNGEIVVRPMMYVALSYDHRLVDGRESVQFLGRIKELVEDPASLLLGV
jgi:2-oxoglutarate dehydrogenase E2 component (dihydrolipoamide succinyltransferase)